MPEPHLIHVSADAQGRLVAVDSDGGLWRGQVKRDRDGSEYITWKRMRSEFDHKTPEPETSEERSP
jgi:hypothetical protein